VRAEITERFILSTKCERIANNEAKLRFVEDEATTAHQLKRPLRPESRAKVLNMLRLPQRGHRRLLVRVHEGRERTAIFDELPFIRPTEERFHRLRCRLLSKGLRIDDDRFDFVGLLYRIERRPGSSAQECADVDVPSSCLALRIGDALDTHNALVRSCARKRPPPAIATSGRPQLTALASKITSTVPTSIEPPTSAEAGQLSETRSFC